LLIDLDGTVLPESNRPTARVLQAIAAASKLIPVAIASGRVQDDVCHFARLFGLTTPQISDNGATLMNPLTGRSISRRTLNRNQAELVISDLKTISSRILVSDAGRFIDDPDNISDWQLSIVMAKFDDETEARDWAGRFSPDVVSSYASVDNKGDWYVDYTGAGISKATGATDFAAEVGVEVGDLMVIGDGWNDPPMFEVAGTRVAMGGSPQHLIDLATDVVPDVEDDGAAVAIEKYVLNRG